MAKMLVSSWSDGKTLPESYIVPPQDRPKDITYSVTKSKSVPVIDLSIDDHELLVQQIIEAGRDYGGFQVINHGVPKKLMDDLRAVFKEFFQLPDDEKSKYCDGDYNKCRLLTSTIGYNLEKVHLWRDLLKHTCNDPLEESMQYWPDKPDNYREVVGEYVKKAYAMGSRLLELIGEGLGLEPGYFAKELTEVKNFGVNHYPPCPEPSLTLGVGYHTDPTTITILIQGDVPGLQVLKDGEWLTVEPIPDALIVSFGHFIQIITNGKMKADVHRAVTNAKEGRISGVLFISPANDYVVEPAKALVNEENPARYEPIKFLEYFMKVNKGMKAT